MRNNPVPSEYNPVEPPGAVSIVWLARKAAKLLRHANAKRSVYMIDFAYEASKNHIEGSP
jgi:hypothetical protein